MAQDVDGGTTFGTWTDSCAQYMYKTSFLELVNTEQFRGMNVLDVGGGNGLLKTLLSEANVTTVDIDANKRPDICQDALTYIPDTSPDVVFARYVLHYLTTTQATRLLAHIGTYCKRMVIIQFVNDWSAIDIKRSISQGSGDHAKTFYRWGDLFALCDRQPWVINRTATTKTTITAEFYRNRLGVSGARQHTESIVMLELQHIGDNK